MKINCALDWPERWHLKHSQTTATLLTNVHSDLCKNVSYTTTVCRVSTYIQGWWFFLSRYIIYVLTSSLNADHLLFRLGEWLYNTTQKICDGQRVRYGKTNQPWKVSNPGENLIENSWTRALLSMQRKAQQKNPMHSPPLVFPDFFVQDFRNVSPGLTVWKWCSRTPMKATAVTIATPIIWSLIPSHCPATNPTNWARWLSSSRFRFSPMNLKRLCRSANQLWFQKRNIRHGDNHVDLVPQSRVTSSKNTAALPNIYLAISLWALMVTIPFKDSAKWA